MERRQLVRETQNRVRARQGVVLALVLLFPGGRDEVYGRELHLFSAVSGIVTDRTTTDPAGRFSFPEIAVRTFLATVLPHEPMVEQTVTIRYRGREYLAWEHVRRSYEPTDELGGMALDFTCDLGHDLANPAGTAMREDTWLHGT
jgi:hypothetical protein